MNNPKLHFITFYTQGKPFDNALSLENEKNILIKALAPYVDYSRAVSCSELRGNVDTEIYVRPFDEIASRNFKTNEIGFLRWKPYIILKELENMNEGDIIFYRDCNVTKYKDILFDTKNIRENIKSVLDYCNTDFYAPMENYPRLRTKSFVKQEVFDYFSLGENSDSYLINASIIIVRKSKKSIDFLEKWLDANMSDDLLSPVFDVNKNPNLKWNTQEQAILNGLLIKEGLVKNWLSFKNSRKFTIDNFSFLPKNIIVFYGNLSELNNGSFIRKTLNLINADIVYTGWSEENLSLEAVKDKLMGVIDFGNNNLIKIDVESYSCWESGVSKINKNKYEVKELSKLYKLNRANALLNNLDKKYDSVFFLNLNNDLNRDFPVYYFRESLNFLKIPRKIYGFSESKSEFINEINLDFLWGRAEVFEDISQLWIDIESAESMYNLLGKVDKYNIESLLYYYSIIKKIMYQPIN